jgi:hypothetical protein
MKALVGVNHVSFIFFRLLMLKIWKELDVLSRKKDSQKEEVDLLDTWPPFAI